MTNKITAPCGPAAMVAEGDDGLHSGLDRSSTGTSPRRGLTTEFDEVLLFGLKMATKPRVDLVCENANRNGQRVSVSLSEQTVTFFNCHQLRSGLGVGFEPVRVCSFEKIVAVHDFLVGEHRGIFLRILLMMGRLIHVNARAEDLASIFVIQKGCNRAIQTRARSASFEVASLQPSQPETSVRDSSVAFYQSLSKSLAEASGDDDSLCCRTVDLRKS